MKERTGYYPPEEQHVSTSAAAEDEGIRPPLPPYLLLLYSAVLHSFPLPIFFLWGDQSPSDLKGKGRKRHIQAYF